MTAWQIAIETCMRQGSVALLREDELIEQVMLPTETRTAQSLAPAVARLLELPPRGRRDIALVSASVGPGSFTGIRIGVTAAKSLAYALGCRVVACDTLAAIVAQVRWAQTGLVQPGSFERGSSAAEAAPSAEADADQGDADWREAGAIDAAINAYRGQVYCRRESRSGEVLLPSQAVDRPEWLESLDSSSVALATAGDVWGRIESAPATACRAPASLWHPMAATIGRLGWELHRREASVDPMRLQPAYLRASAAEEKRSLQTADSSATASAPRNSTPGSSTPSTPR